MSSEKPGYMMGPSNMPDLKLFYNSAGVTIKQVKFVYDGWQYFELKRNNGPIYNSFTFAVPYSHRANNFTENSSKLFSVFNLFVSISPDEFAESLKELLDSKESILGFDRFDFLFNAGILRGDEDKYIGLLDHFCYLIDNNISRNDYCVAFMDRMSCIIEECFNHINDKKIYYYIQDSNIQNMRNTINNIIINQNDSIVIKQLERLDKLVSKMEKDRGIRDNTNLTPDSDTTTPSTGVSSEDSSPVQPMKTSPNKNIPSTTFFVDPNATEVTPVAVYTKFVRK